MQPASAEVASEIERYLRTGDTDPNHLAWSGASFLDVARRAREDLIGALVAAVQGRSGDPRTLQALAEIDPVAL